MSGSRSRGFASAMKRLLKILLIFLLVAFLVCGIAGSIFLVHTIRKAPDIRQVTVTPGESATYIYAQDGTRQQKLTLPEANRDLVSISRVPLQVQHAFVAVEDARFYRHNGIDIPGILRALVRGILSGSFSEGASTITQQLLKNTVFTSWTEEKTFMDRLQRKIQEQYLAIQLEKILTKDQILEDYLNIINLGSGCYGIQSAAYHYFGKDVSDLTLSEAVVIAGITQNPTYYDPTAHPDHNLTRREVILALMLDQGYISDQEYQEAIADRVYERIRSNEDNLASQVSVYSYYQDALIDQVLEDLMNARGFTYKQAFKAVYAGGLRIYSAQDDAIQQICDEEFANPANFPAGTKYGIDYALSVEDSEGNVTHYGNGDLQSYIRQTQSASFRLLCDTREEAEDFAARFREHIVSEDITVLGERITITPQPQASVTIIDPSTGYVRAVVGGRGTKEASLTLNRATYTTRQPGSTFKILAVFAPALEECHKTLATTYDNSPFWYSDGTPVSNWDGETGQGSVSIRDAITSSVNIPTVRCFQEVTPQRGYQYVRSFGISTVVDQYESEGQILTDIAESLALGGLTLGVTNLELCASYACIANQGQYIAPKFYTKVTDQEGNILLDNTVPASRTVLRESTASLLTLAMQDVISDPEGTAYGLINLGSMPSAGKSGTTSDDRDIWFAGYTPYYACCVWGGYDNNSPLPEDGNGRTYSKILWNAIMGCIHEDLRPVPFRLAMDLVSLSVCTQSGMAATALCPSYTEYFSLDSQPAGSCPIHGAAGQQSSPGQQGSGTNSGQQGIYSGQQGYSGQHGTYPGQQGTYSGQQGSSAGSLPSSDIPDIVIINEDSTTWGGSSGSASDPWGAGSSGQPGTYSDPSAGNSTDPWAGSYSDPWGAGSSGQPGTYSDPWAGNSTDPWAGSYSDPWGAGSSEQPGTYSDPWAGNSTDPWAGSYSDPWQGQNLSPDVMQILDQIPEAD